MRGLPNWKGQDAVVIGGGPSLKDFPFDVLIPENTVGCNAAFRLGPKVCSVVFFGDYKTFFLPFEEDLKRFPGPVYTCSSRLRKQRLPWLHCLPRKPDGLHLDAIGWGGNTGCAAINFAIAAGAQRVYLLGYDMCSTNDAKHWHTAYAEKQDRQTHERPQNYPRFVQGFDALAKDWITKFPNRGIINVTDCSTLECFPKMPVAEFLTERKAA